MVHSGEESTISAKHGSVSTMYAAAFFIFAEEYATRGMMPAGDSRGIWGRMPA